MKENEPLYIRTVSNGFIVEPARGRAVELTTEKEMKVFRSMNELNWFISNHFSYRGKHIESDT